MGTNKCIMGDVQLAKSITEHLRLRAHGRNNSQHCCANNVGSCCVCVGSGVQTDATTMLGVVANKVASVWTGLKAAC